MEAPRYAALHRWLARHFIRMSYLRPHYGLLQLYQLIGQKINRNCNKNRDDFRVPKQESQQIFAYLCKSRQSQQIFTENRCILPTSAAIAPCAGLADWDDQLAVDQDIEFPLDRPGGFADGLCQLGSRMVRTVCQDDKETFLPASQCGRRCVLPLNRRLVLDRPGEHAHDKSVPLIYQVRRRVFSSLEGVENRVEAQPEPFDRANLVQQLRERRVTGKLPIAEILHGEAVG